MIRLYFRPCSPTQFVVEGIRPTSQLRYAGTHCPVPVVFLFDSHEILTRHDTLFSDGNLASPYAEVSDQSDAFGDLPFKWIYHSSPVYGEPERSQVMFHRNAEVIVPDPLNLTGLQRIATRSVAEYETLRNLLSHSKRRFWASRIEPGVRPGLHAGRWSYIERVDMSASQITLRFNPVTETPGPFRLICEIVEHNTGKMYSLTKTEFTAKQPLTMNLLNLSDPREYRLRVRLDENLAYQGEYEESDLPF